MSSTRARMCNSHVSICSVQLKFKELLISSVVSRRRKVYMLMIRYFDEFTV